MEVFNTDKMEDEIVQIIDLEEQYLNFLNEKDRALVYMNLDKVKKILREVIKREQQLEFKLHDLDVYVKENDEISYILSIESFVQHLNLRSTFYTD